MSLYIEAGCHCGVYLSGRSGQYGIALWEPLLFHGLGGRREVQRG